MNMLRPATKVTAVCIGIIAFAAILCFAANQYLRFDYPVVLKMYGAYPVYGGGDGENMNQDLFRIPFIQCEAGKHRIIGVSFNELPDLDLEDDGLSDKDSGVGSDGGGYYTRGELTISLFEDGETHKGLKQPVTLTKARISYDDNTQETIDLGKIVLYPESDEEEAGLKNNGDVYEEGGARRVSFMAGKEVILRDYACIPDLPGVNLQVNKRDFSDIKDQIIKKDQQLDFALTMNGDKFTLYEPALEVTYETKDGGRHTQILGSLKKDLYEERSFIEAYFYLKERGVIR